MYALRSVGMLLVRLATGYTAWMSDPRVLISSWASKILAGVMKRA